MTRTQVMTQPDAQQSCGVVFGGVDTHQLVHRAAVVDQRLGEVADREFATTQAGYRELLAWLDSYGALARVGVESTGAYGAGLTRFLQANGVEVLEVRQPEKATRVSQGKSDAIDAYSAARQAAAGVSRGGRPMGLAKVTTGPVESIRMIKVARDGAVRDRTRGYSQLRDLVTTAPAEIHDELIGLTGPQRVKRAAGYRPDPTRLHEPTTAIKKALRAVARRIQRLDEEIAEADRDLAALTHRVVPTLLDLPQIGPQTAAQLLVTAGQNVDRLSTEASFAKLVGVAPLPASSGKSGTRHRLNRGGDRQANSVLYLAVVGRIRSHPPTQAYITRRMSEGKTKTDAIRCLKRYLARSIYQALRTDLAALDDL